MHPILFRFPRPGFLPGDEFITIYSYGFFIATGVVLAFLYGVWEAYKKYNVTFKQAIIFINSAVIAGLLGAKVFSWFEKPMEFFMHGENLVTHNHQGFVLYGAVIFIIPVTIVLTRIYKIPTWGLFDIIGVAFPIMFMLVRVGCFSAGCCYGVPTDSVFGVVFSNPTCPAHPKDVPLHPTQLYSIFMNLCVLLLLLIVKRKQQFTGQLFLSFLVLYGIGRSIVEAFRGDDRRGFVFDGAISYGQLTSIVLIIIALILYIYLYRKAKKAVD